MDGHQLARHGTVVAAPCMGLLRLSVERPLLAEWDALITERCEDCGRVVSARWVIPPEVLTTDEEDGA